jgi:hypothetical protein
VAVPEFDTFIAIDWSGAARNYNGIAVAMCRSGRAAPKLIGARWRRRDVSDWLKAQLDKPQRLLIGFDFAFGFPFEPGCGYLGGKAPGVDDIFALWSLIEARSSGDDDFGCSRFVSHPDYAGLFWTAGTKPDSWIERKRRTEHVCAETTQTRPDTLYKLLHSKQVGKASITGMRVLHDLRASGRRVSIWPFETVQNSAVVEIYPTMFRRRATGSVAKIKSPAILNAALAALGSRQLSEVPRALSDHDTDALISAVGLRSLAGSPGIWTPAESKSPCVQREGWIFGTGLQH